MAGYALRQFKFACTVIGSRLSKARLHQVQMVVNYMKLGAWMKRMGFHVASRSIDRLGVFEAVAERVQGKRVLYLEFGVFQGASIRFWSSALKHPDTRLHGFDSFEGLPEDFDYDGPYTRGTFNVSGQIPAVDDSRVRFFKGWFNETLPRYVVPDHDILVMTMDADLYSSTAYVLQFFRDKIKVGTFIYFDDMSRPDHEPRAFESFMCETGYVFRLVAADQPLNCAFFERIA